MKKFVKVIFLALLLLVTLPTVNFALAENGNLESKTIRVGYMNHPGFIEIRGDKYYGYGVEYINKICEHTKWQVEYVYAPWSEQLEKLQSGDIDIVPLAQYTKERAEQFIYSKQALGLIQCLLLTLPQSDIESNAISCNGKKIGILKGSRNIDLLKNYADNMGFTYDKFEYDYQREVEKALIDGEVDIIACEQMIEAQNFRVLDRFASDPYYFISSNSNLELMNELDDVISKINAFDPNYASKLYQKYFGESLSSSRPYFSKEEIEFLNSHNEITIALIPDNTPFSYIDKTGEIKGIFPEIIKIVSEFSNVSVKYEFVPKNLTPFAYLQQNPTYLATGVLANNSAFYENDMLISDVYITTYCALVARSNNANSLNYHTGEHLVGIPSSFQSAELFINKDYPNLKIKKFLSIDDGLNALEKGKIDFFAYPINAIMPYIANPRYGEIQIVDSQFMSCPLCTIGVNSEDNKYYIDIFNKCIACIPNAYISQIEGDYLRQNLYRFNDNDAFHRYQPVIVHIAIFVALIIFALLLYLWLRQRKFNRDITLHSEYDMMTGLYNRATVKKKAIDVLEQNKGRNCALIVFDIDELNRINETNGHAVGDEVIKVVANIVKTQFGGSAIIGRVGGDDFTVILIGMESKSVLVSILAKFQKMIGSTIISGVDMALGVSVGVDMFVSGEISVDEAFSHANEAMHLVKNSGKNGFAFYSAKNNSSYKAIYQKPTKNDWQIAEINSDDQLDVQESFNEIVSSNMECDSDFRNLIEAFPNVALYVIDEKTHKVLYYNKRFKEICPKIELGVSCKNIMVGPCQNCIVDTMGEQKMAHTIYYSDAFGDEVEITATKITWKDTPAVMIFSWPRTVLTSSNDKLQRSSNQDSFDYITGGFTRQGFIRMMERMRSGGVDLTEYAILFINIQDFKAVNELVGSKGGDNLLRTVFARIEQSDFHPIIGARKESDHFVYLVEKNSLDLSKLSNLINFHWEYDGKDLFILGRCGVFMIDDNDLDVYKMIDRAKLAKEHIVDEYIQPYAIYNQSMMKDYSEKAQAFLLFD